MFLVVRQNLLQYFNNSSTRYLKIATSVGLVRFIFGYVAGIFLYLGQVHLRIFSHLRRIIEQTFTSKTKHFCYHLFSGVAWEGFYISNEILVTLPSFLFYCINRKLRLIFYLFGNYSKLNFYKCWFFFSFPLIF